MKLNEIVAQNFAIRNTDLKDRMLQPIYPYHVTGYFDCEDANLLTSLENCPSVVDGFFDCCKTSITSLEHAPIKVGSFFKCSKTAITSLKFCPENAGSVLCSTTQLTDLESAPMVVNGSFNCSNNNITSLSGIGKRFLKTIKGNFVCDDSRITSNVLGFLLVNKLQQVLVDIKKDHLIWKAIINEHLNKDRDIMECREELIAAGLKEYAKL